MNINKWIIYTISGLFVVSGLFCFISVAYTSIENVTAKGLQEKIEECKEELAQLSKEEASLSDWRDIQTYFDQFKEEYLMKVDEFSKFRDNLRMTFNEYGLQNQGVNHNYRREADYMRVEVFFSVQGTYPKIKRFIHDILGRKEMIVIKSIKLTRDRRTGRIAGNFKMEVYIVKK